MLIRIATMKRVMLTAIIFCAWSIAAQAVTTGNKLKDYCSFSPSHTEASIACAAYIGGVLDAFRIQNQHQASRLYCEPPSAEGEQLVDIIKKYLSAHPERLHFAASTLILEVMIMAFPCK